MGNCEAWSRDNRYGLRVPSRILEKMLVFCRMAEGMETGGILVGYYNRAHDCAIVTDSSAAPEDSFCGRRSFWRGISGLQMWLLFLWNRTRRRYYLGEWHFHPRASPEPSSTDVAQMKQNARDPSYNCPEPILLLLAGDPNRNWSVRSFICIRGNDIIELSQGWQRRE
jgi:integrative and conjugative element protein (TIGR02256 family)